MREGAPCNREETICAVATPNGVGSIGVIRVSGEQAIPIVQKIFRGREGGKGEADSGQRLLSNFVSHTVHYGDIVDPKTGMLVDEALLIVMRAPRSYTGEDVVEIQSHGNPSLLQRILSALTAEGARLAHPGEFTRRAFLSGRMDLSQAEAVMELITAQSRRAEEMAVRQLQGGLSRAIDALRDTLVSLLSQIEAAIDFTEQGIELCAPGVMIAGISRAAQSVTDLLAGYETGRQIREGSVVVLVGRPNTGKSSLMNRLLDEDRAIVTPIPGTTRDTLSETLMLNGHRVRIVDTAGFHDTTHPIEKEGIKRSEAAIQEGDLILFVLDAAIPLGPEEIALEHKIAGKKKIIVLNKCDLPNALSVEMASVRYPGDPIVSCSAKTGERIADLRDQIVSCVVPKADEASDQHPRVTLLRHRNQLEAALSGLKRALTAVSENASPEFIAADLRAAVEAVDEIIGKTPNEAVLDRIFSQFCIGK